MSCARSSCISIYSVAVIALALSTLITAIPVSAQAEKFTVIHAFAGQDGEFPYAGLTADRAGNFYGMTSAGGNTGCQSGLGCGTVFKLSRSSTGWKLTTLYVFQGGLDGWQPDARVLLGDDGVLYGTTRYGGVLAGYFGYGTIFKLKPPDDECEDVSCPWTHTVLYRFSGGSDGAYPGPGDLTFDRAGNIYGTTEAGGIINSSCFLGNQGCGVVFELAPSGRGWKERVVYSFTGGTDGDLPLAGVIFDENGSLYGTASEGGASGYFGTVFQLTRSASGWTENTLHSFNGFDGAYSAGGLIFDGSGNLYGTTSASYTYGGTIFELTPSGGAWTFKVLKLLSFPNSPFANLTLFKGNLYGTTPDGGSNGFGSVFELIRGSAGWTFATLYSFAPNAAVYPWGGVLADRSGRLYGTASGGGLHSDGVVFEITP
jgi:uncharacterized repeat protein (TIGR03803 family)